MRDVQMGALNSLQQNVEAGEGWSVAGPEQALGQGMLPELEKGALQPRLLHGQHTGNTWASPEVARILESLPCTSMRKRKEQIRCANQMGLR